MDRHEECQMLEALSYVQAQHWIAGVGTFHRTRSVRTSLRTAIHERRKSMKTPIVYSATGYENSFDDVDDTIEFVSRTIKLVTHLHVQTASSIPEIHSNLLRPKFPSFPPFFPGFFQFSWSRWHPHSNSENHIFLIITVLSHIKQSVSYAPLTADTKRNSVSIQVKL